jgi:hypothetical protein
MQLVEIDEADAGAQNRVVAVVIRAPWCRHRN